MAGVIYIAENKYWGKDIHKIGCTSKTNAEGRLAAANGSTWNPDTTAIAYEILVNNERAMERLVHDALREVRISDKREFFKVSITDAIATIEDLYQKHKNDASNVSIESYGRLDYLLFSDVDPFAIYREFQSLDQNVRLYFLKRALDREDRTAEQYVKRLKIKPNSRAEWSDVEAKALSWLGNYLRSLINHLQWHGEQGDGAAHFKLFFVCRTAKEKKIERLQHIWWESKEGLLKAKELGYRKAAIWDARLANDSRDRKTIRDQYFAGLEAVKAGYAEGYHYMAAFLSDTRIDESRDAEIRWFLLQSARDGNPDSWEMLAREYEYLGESNRAIYCNDRSRRAEMAWAWCYRKMEKWYDDFCRKLPDGRTVLELRIDE